MDTLKSFKEEPVQVLTLDQLRGTHMENFPNGQPVGGIYHHTFISELLGLLTKHGIDYEVGEIFAANNQDKRSPGVTVIKDIAEREGEHALAAHILRRVFCNITLRGVMAGDEMGYNLAVSYTQQGISVGFGPMVYVCHNQCICRAERVVSNYTIRGNARVSNEYRQTDRYMRLLESEVVNILPNAQADEQTLCDMREAPVTESDIREIIGRMVIARCRANHTNPMVRANSVPPLTSAQINAAASRMLGNKFEHVETCYDLYQEFNRFLKPRDVPFEQICPQSLAIFDIIQQHAYFKNHGRENE